MQEKIDDILAILFGAWMGIMGTMFLAVTFMVVYHFWKYVFYYFAR
jgi:hypothetical protein